MACEPVRVTVHQCSSGGVAGLQVTTRHVGRPRARIQNGTSYYLVCYIYNVIV